VKALFYARSCRHHRRARLISYGSLLIQAFFDAGVFSVDPQGNGFLKVPVLSEADKAQKFSVTLEPAGGVPNRPETCTCWDLVMTDLW
jgi:hypothetical protein